MLIIFSLIYIHIQVRLRYVLHGHDPNSSYCYFEGHSSSIVPEDTALLKENFNKAPQWFT